MKPMRLMPALVLIMLCSSCVPLSSLYPLWDEGHVAELPGLAGTWAEADGSTLRFVKGNGKVYTATYSSEKETSRYEVHAVDLNGRLFLDFFPDQDALEKRLAGEAYLPLVQVHFFGRIVLSGDSLRLALLDDDKVEAKVKSGNLSIPLLKRDDGFLLTMETKAIQEFLSRYADDPDIWGDEAAFRRGESGVAPKEIQ
jgi:hypothetical protein